MFPRKIEKEKREKERERERERKIDRFLKTVWTLETSKDHEIKGPQSNEVDDAACNHRDFVFRESRETPPGANRLVSLLYTVFLSFSFFSTSSSCSLVAKFLSFWNDEMLKSSWKSSPQRRGYSTSISTYFFIRRFAYLEKQKKNMKRVDREVKLGINLRKKKKKNHFI